MDTAILQNLAKAEHQVTDAEQRVARQRELLRELVGSGLPDLARTARDALEAMQEHLSTVTVSSKNLLRRVWRGDAGARAAALT
jgi:outer membrane protein TolC